MSITYWQEKCGHLGHLLSQAEEKNTRLHDLEQSCERLADTHQKQLDASVRARERLEHKLKEQGCRLHQLSEDHSHCEDLLHELGERASRAESRLSKISELCDLDEDGVMIKQISDLATPSPTSRHIKNERDSALLRLDSISAALADPHNNPLAAIRRILAGGVETHALKSDGG